MDEIPFGTIRVVHKLIPVPFVVINEIDFDEAVHEHYPKAESPAESPPPVIEPESPAEDPAAPSVATKTTTTAKTATAK